MSDFCQWLHEQLEPLLLVKYPFDLERLPANGVYFFYEEGEIWGHGGGKPRIVRVGTHREGNFRSRIAEHFLLNEARMNFGLTTAPPHDRSIFRKHIGRALLNRDHDDYLSIWNIDFMKREVREKQGHLRNLNTERRVEAEVTRVLRGNFSFRFIVLEDQAERMGTEGVEKRLIGTLAHCDVCKASEGWLGHHSPIEKVRESGLWLVHHLAAKPLTEKDIVRIPIAIKATRDWLQGSG